MGLFKNRKLRKMIAAKAKRCCYCGNSFGERVIHDGKSIRLKKTLDHIVPKSRGGTDDVRNSIIACQVCNILKGQNIYLTLKGARKAILRNWERRGYLIQTKN